MRFGPCSVYLRGIRRAAAFGEGAVLESEEDTIGRYRRLVGEGAIADDDAQRAAVEKLQAIRVRLLAARAGGLGRWLRRSRPAPGDQGLYLYGSVGRGKSMLMDIFFRTVPLEQKRRVHFFEFMQEVHQLVRAARARGGGAPVQQVAKGIADSTRLLCFDEFQVEDIADAMILGQLFEALFESGVTVVATSNTPPGALYRDGLNRALFLPFVALISERLDLHHLAGPRDYRADGVGHGVYFAPLGAEADREMDDAWQQELGGRKATARTLRVLEREIMIPQSCGSLMRADFETLCGAAMGPADYLALAAAFRVVFLDRVPRLPPSRRNAARRLLTLVDALYEARCLLVVSADGEPGELYPEGDGANAFARTASRLLEMRSVDYVLRSRVPVAPSTSKAATAAQPPSTNSKL